MPSWVATHSDLMLAGIAPAACVPDARQLAAVLFASGLFELDGHGFDGGEQVRFAALVGNALPTGIAPATYYTVAPTLGNPDFFALAPPLTPSDAGVGTITVVENVIPKIDRIMAQWTSMLVASATAYQAPWTTPPGWAPLLVAQLAAPTIANVLRIPAARYPVKMVEDGFVHAQAMLAKLMAGGTFNDGVGPIDAEQTTGTYDTARATNSIQQGLVPSTGWVTGML